MLHHSSRSSGQRRLNRARIPAGIQGTNILSVCPMVPWHSLHSWNQGASFCYLHRMFEGTLASSPILVGIPGTNFLSVCPMVSHSWDSRLLLSAPYDLAIMSRFSWDSRHKILSVCPMVPEHPSFSRDSRCRHFSFLSGFRVRTSFLFNGTLAFPRTVRIQGAKLCPLVPRFPPPPTNFRIQSTNIFSLHLIIGPLLPSSLCVLVRTRSTNLLMLSLFT